MKDETIELNDGKFYVNDIQLYMANSETEELVEINKLSAYIKSSGFTASTIKLINNSDATKIFECSFNSEDNTLSATGIVAGEYKLILNGQEIGKINLQDPLTEEVPTV